MNILKIVPLDKRRSKVLFDEDLALILYRGEIRRYHMEEDGELSMEEYQEIVDKVLCPRAKERMLYLLEASDKTEAELRKKLAEGGYPMQAVEAAIDFGKKHRYIDDTGYVERYIRHHGRRKSKRQIEYELLQKGIDKSLIQYQMEEAPVDEVGLVHSYLRKKGMEGRVLSREEEKKAAMALARKGIPWDIIRSAMKEDVQSDL